MYRLKEEFVDFFKEFRTNAYAKYMGCDATYVSSIINASKSCTTLFAQSIISVRFDVSVRHIVENDLLEKYFTKEK